MRHTDERPGAPTVGGLRRWMVWSVAVALCLVGCEDADTQGAPDATGSPADAAGSREEGGAPPTDAAGSPADAAGSHEDGGAPPTDAAGSPEDAAPPLEDATPPPEDAAPPPEPPAALDAAELMARADLFIGTGGQAFGYAAQTPAAQWPRGLVRLGPDSTDQGRHPNFHHFSGYHFDDGQIRGFSHTHFVGTGVEDLGNLRVLPVPGAEAIAPGRHFLDKRAETEHAEPGRYGVQLADAEGRGIDVALASSLRAGWHRYEALDGGPFVLQFDVAASVNDRGVEAAELHIEPDGGLRGFVRYNGPMTGRTRSFTLYFDAVVDRAPTALSLWRSDEPLPAQAEVQSWRGPEEALEGSGLQLGALLRFEGAGPVNLAVGLSYVDAAGARANRLTELGAPGPGQAGVGLEAVARTAHEAWRALYEDVRVVGDDGAALINFASALYQSHTMPTRLDDVDGRYRGLDGEVHTLPDPQAVFGEPGEALAYYTDLSLWDTFRTLHPWYALTAPDVQRDVLRSLAWMGEQWGVIPRWPGILSETGSMIGTSADLLFAEGAAKDLLPLAFFEAHFDRLLGSHGPRRAGFDAYLALGWVPDDEVSGSVSNTVEFAYADAMLAPLAERLGRPEAEALSERGRSWRNHFNPETGFLDPRRADGAFAPRPPTQVFHSGGPFVEGSAWHWRWSAFQDPEGLAELLGGPQALGEALTTYFERSRLDTPRYLPAAPDPYYWHGNEPSLHAVWLWHVAHKPEALADWLRAIQRTVYTPAPDGRPGNDDGGTLSAWYLFAACGLYPVAGSDRYWLGPPLLPRVELRTAQGALQIVAPGASDARRYVRGVFVDGAPHEAPWIDHATLIGASELRFELALTP